MARRLKEIQVLFKILSTVRNQRVSGLDYPLRLTITKKTGAGEVGQGSEVRKQESRK